MLPTTLHSIPRLNFTRDIPDISDNTKVITDLQDDTKATSISFDLIGLYNQFQEVDGENLVEEFIEPDDVTPVVGPICFHDLLELRFKDQFKTSRARHEQRKILIAKMFTELSTASRSELSDILAEGVESRSRVMLLACMQFVVGLDDTGGDAIKAKQLIADLLRNQSDAISTEVFGKGPISLPGIDLRGINFIGINGYNANFNHANLAGATFEKSNLDLAEICCANLRGVKFIDTDLQSADFVNSDLSFASFVGIELDGTNFAGADLTHADFTGANIIHADCSHSDLRHAKFCGATVGYLPLSTAIVRGTDFQGANITHYNWEGVDFSGSNFRGTNLGEASLFGANVYMADLTGTGLSRENLRGAIWKENDLSDLGLDQDYWQTIPALNFEPAHIERPTSQLTQPALKNTDLATHQSCSPLRRQGTDFQAQRNSVFISQDSNQSDPELLQKPALTSLTPVQSIGPTKTTSPVGVHLNIPPEASQALPSARPSLWGWLFNITGRIGRFFEAIYWRLWGAS